MDGTPTTNVYVNKENQVGDKVQITCLYKFMSLIDGGQSSIQSLDLEGPPLWQGAEAVP